MEFQHCQEFVIMSSPDTIKLKDDHMGEEMQG